jgi:hypothetical protein
MTFLEFTIKFGHSRGNCIIYVNGLMRHEGEVKEEDKVYIRVPKEGYD